MSKVITWQAPGGAEIDVTPAQETMLTAAGKWPRDQSGQEYCTVSRGLHQGEPTFTDAELRADVGMEPERQLKLVEGRKYTVASLRLVSWTAGDGSGHAGYHMADYFAPDGSYLGPDADGIEPVVEAL